PGQAVELTLGFDLLEYLRLACGAAALSDVADALTYFDRVFAQVVPRDRRFARGGGEQGGEHAQCGCLARAVRAEAPDESARADIDVDAAHGQYGFGAAPLLAELAREPPRLAHEYPSGNRLRKRRYSMPSVSDTLERINPGHPEKPLTCEPVRNPSLPGRRVGEPVTSTRGSACDKSFRAPAGAFGNRPRYGSSEGERLIGWRVRPVPGTWLFGSVADSVCDVSI